MEILSAMEVPPEVEVLLPREVLPVMEVLLVRKVLLEMVVPPIREVLPEMVMDILVGDGSLMGMSEIRDSLAASLTWKVPDFGLPRRPSRRGKVGVFNGLTAPRSRGSGTRWTSPTWGSWSSRR